MWMLIAALLLIAGALVFTLFVRAEDIPEPVPTPPTQHLEERKARIYENLRDLQFEYRLGKLSDEDYQKTKQSLQAELAATLAEIDAVKPVLEVPPVSPAAKAAAAAVQKKPASNTCPHCGAKFAQSLKFCGECGKAMAS